MKKTLFVVSDIHGFYNELVSALKESGFDENNENHLLIVCGDLFDRGPDSVKVFEYLYNLENNGKAIVIKGNHDEMLVNYLTGKDKLPWNYMKNGTNETLGDFWHRTNPFESWAILEKKAEYGTQELFEEWLMLVRNDISKEYPHLIEWLDNLPYYYETKNHIFTHAAIDITAEDWHFPHVPWKDLIWDDGSFFGKPIKNTDKTVVIGHFGTSHLRELYGLDFEKEPYETLEREDGRVIALDTTTVLSHKVNVLLILEDELI